MKFLVGNDYESLGFTDEQSFLAQRANVLQSISDRTIAKIDEDILKYAPEHSVKKYAPTICSLDDRRIMIEKGKKNLMMANMIA